MFGRRKEPPSSPPPGDGPEPFPIDKMDKALVLEVAFDSIHSSSRHKSGLAMRFPRISRIRTDKPAYEADLIETLRKLAT